MSTQRGNKNSDAIRILQRDRDASARATHLKAEIGMVPNSTIERKIMSTKTSIKRIALVAAAALALGGFSAVSASAADNANLKFAAGDGAAASPYNTGNGVAGPANSVTITLAATAAKDSLVTITGGTVASVDTTTAVVSADAKSVNWASKYQAGTVTITIPTPVVGVITANLYTGTNGIYGTTVVESVAITVSPAKSSGVYSAAKTTVFLAAGETSTPATADAVLTYPGDTSAAAGDSSSATTYKAGTIQVLYLDTLGAPITGAADSITATIISGPGTIASTGVNTSDSTTAIGASTTSAASGGIKNVANQYSVSSKTSSAGWANFVVYPNGQIGVSTIVLKNNAGTEIGRKTITWTSSTAASYTATVVKKYVDGDAAASPSSGYAAIKLVVKDAAGNLISGATAPTITSSSSYLTVENSPDGYDTNTTDATGVIYFRAKSSLAATYGDATITFTSPDTLVTATAVLTWSSKVAATLTITTSDSVDVGSPVTYTLTAKDKNGRVVPDGIAASNWVGTTTATTTTAGIGVPTITGKTANGSASLVSTGATVAASKGTATFTLEGTAGTANSYLSAALAGSTVAVTTSITSPDNGASSLAYDAASAATDAANNAYEEAQNATQAASDALAAVKALAVQVKALIALVNKIKAKLKA